MSFNQSDSVLSVLPKSEDSLVSTRKMMSGKPSINLHTSQHNALSANLHISKFVIRREVQPKGEGKKPYTKAPKIQRLITPQRLQHKRHRIALKRRRAENSKDQAVSYSLLCSSGF